MFRSHWHRQLSEDQLATVKVTGIADAFAKHEQGETKGVKVHFAMDKSGVLSIDKSDIQFELQPEEAVCFGHNRPSPFTAPAAHNLRGHPRLALRHVLHADWRRREADRLRGRRLCVQ